MPDTEKIDPFRSVSAELKKQDSLLESLGKRFAHNNNLGKIALEISKDKMSAEQRVSSLQDSIAQKTKDLIELEDLRNINIRTGGNIGNDIRKEQLRYLNLIKGENEELARQEEIIANNLVKQKVGLTNLANKAKEYNQILKANPMILAGAAAYAVVVYSVKKIWETFKQLDAAAAEFRKSMGITRNDSKDIEATARGIAIQYMALGVTAKDVYESFKSIAEIFGSTLVASKDIVKDMSLFTAQLGISTKTSAQFLKSMAMVSGTTSHTQKDMMMIAKSMAAAAGVPLDSVMQDVAAASKENYQFLSRNPLELIKAAVKAKELGTSLQESAASSRSLLSFTESVKNEMEASVLLGKSMNLQKARELAYHRDIAGLNAEIVKLAKEANFEQLDPFQQDAVAKALGKSAGEVANMLESDREHARVLQHMTAEQRTQYNTMMKMNQSQVKNYAEMARKELETISNQNAIAAITTAWNSIFAKMGSVVLPYIASVLTFIAKLLTGTASGANYIFTALGGVALILAAIASKNYIGKIFGAIAGKGGVIGNGISSISNGMAGLSKGMSSTVTHVTKSIKSFMSLIGEFGTQIGKFISGIAKGVGTGIEVIFKGIANGLKYMGNKEVFKGILALGLLGLSIIPFAFAMKMMTGLDWKSLGVAAVALVAFTAAAFGLGALMVSGAGAVIFAAGAVAIAALGVALIPFAYAAQKAGKAMVDLGGGFKSIVEGMVELQSLTFTDTIVQLYKLTSAITDVSKAIKGIPDMKVEKLKALIIPDTAGTKDAGTKDDKKKGDSAEDILAAIKAGVEGLRNDMKAGLLTANVYIDSQKLDSAMGRRLSYTGQLT